ncbi:hypothetical protein P7H62_14010 [Vagococcus carniphilus]|jgi:hypothetical protein|uniref:hypothetical protein n=1 Tax=Vagococcus TaxID=2737 RepID=UPI001A8DFF9A|nr:MULTISPECIES: hypothetical protein [Vagococcus]MDR2277998.1 hypothetical protein [Vagococcus sp.]MBO0444283.1 hypothetical protein [Vagococcus fluvialis]MBO0488128.1 hypothetical protein [Vagococcus fluvialis]MDT2832131.1 hypothetical protein [Vagococcus carniphilus]MDT2840965.1 hypothetical protein [Vagococcus carniphilus]
MRQINANIIHYLLLIIFILCGLSVWDVGIQVSKFSNYRKTVNENVARYGGLTPTAMEKINSNSKTYADNRFSIVSNELGVKKKYGEIINYQIKQEYEIKILINKKVTRYTDCSVTSEVR